MSLALVTFAILNPFAAYYLLIKAKIKRMSYKNKFGEVFEGFNFNSYGYLFNGNFLLRRLVYAVSLVFMGSMCVS